MSSEQKELYDDIMSVVTDEYAFLNAPKGLKEKKNMAAASIETRPPLPPFTRENAIEKVRLAEDGWNTRDPGKVALAYAID